MTRTQRVLERDNWQCQYCGGRAIHADHIVPIAMRRRHKGFDGDEWLTASCGPCNWRKGTRRLAPASFADRLDQLPGTWRIWDGSIETLRDTIAR